MALTDYLDLVPSANRQREKFIASLSVALEPILAAIDACASMPAAFDIDLAVGTQLDAVGVRVGMSRYLLTPIAGVYFAFDDDTAGFGSGIWRRRFDPVAGVVALDDNTYRAALKLKAAANAWDGSTGGAQTMLAALAQDDVFLFAQDGFDMSMTIGVAGKIPSLLFLELIRQVVDWVRPATVQVKLAVVTSKSGAPIFGFGAQNEYIGGFGSGAWAKFY